ncbi:hypothetical protein OC842_004338 [Tilletia horrida]|uniref:Feruloyl esterase n=1 Tax=Tilletia horrida TaxID=155126 RepID=A0AAN6JJN8_9BASI|nr:hypothetical protein OC842_004338 [Tilletia horrida]KAK0556044.1 hypothetical protein OC844_005966 [Tilletia horrida]
MLFRQRPYIGRFGTSFPICFSTVLLLIIALSPVAAAPTISNNTVDLPAVQHAGAVSFRTFQADDGQGVPFNVSTTTMGGAAPLSRISGIYAWNFVWRGDAYDSSRPLLLWLGSSASRCNDVSDPGCVLSKGMSEGWPKRIAAHSVYTRTLLDDGNLGVLSIVSPLCYNTTTATPLLNACGTAHDLHALKHYRPDLVQGILQQIQVLYGFDKNKVVGSGASMGGRGILRFGTQFPLRAVSVTGANLETSASRYMKALPYVPWDSGEGCWTLGNPNVNGTACGNSVPQTLPAATRYANVPVQIHASRGDAIANLTTEVQPTCDAINRAVSARAASRRSTFATQPQPKLAEDSTQGRKAPFSKAASSNLTPPGCTIHVQTTPSTNGTLGPTHPSLMRWGYSQTDLNFLVGGYGGAALSFAKNSGA